MAMLDQLTLGDGLASFENNLRMHRLTPLLTRNADNGAGRHRSMRGQRVLDFGAVDVFTAADNHVLEAIDNGDKTVLVHRPHVTGVHPAIAHRGFGQRRLTPITNHDAGTAHRDFAHRAPGQLAVVEIDNPDFADGSGPAGRTQLARLGAIEHVIIGRQDSGNRRQLGHAVGLRKGGA